jgi:hypothetical protein
MEMANDAGLPPHTCPDEELPFSVLDLQDLGAPGSERFTHQAAGLSEDPLEILGAQGEFAEVCEDLLPFYHPRKIWHRRFRYRLPCPGGREAKHQGFVRHSAPPEQR